MSLLEPGVKSANPVSEFSIKCPSYISYMYTYAIQISAHVA